MTRCTPIVANDLQRTGAYLDIDGVEAGGIDAHEEVPSMADWESPTSGQQFRVTVSRSST
jgi:hypothetical protein